MVHIPRGGSLACQIGVRICRAAVAKRGNTDRAVLLGERIAASAGELAVGERLLAGLGPLTLAVANDKPLNPTTGSGLLDLGVCAPEDSARSNPQHVGVQLSNCYRIWYQDRRKPGQNRSPAQAPRGRVRSRRGVFRADRSARIRDDGGFLVLVLSATSGLSWRTTRRIPCLFLRWTPKTQAKASQRSIEGGVRHLLMWEVSDHLRTAEFLERADMLAATTVGRKQTDSTILIREDRDQ